MNKKQIKEFLIKQQRTAIGNLNDENYDAGNKIIKDYMESDEYIQHASRIINLEVALALASGRKKGTKPSDYDFFNNVPMYGYPTLREPLDALLRQHNANYATARASVNTFYENLFNMLKKLTAPQMLERLKDAGLYQPPDLVSEVTSVPGHIDPDLAAHVIHFLSLKALPTPTHQEVTHEQQ